MKGLFSRDAAIRPWCIAMGAALLLTVLWTGPAIADGGVTFTDIADGDSAGITYRRTISPRDANRQDIISRSPIATADFFGNVRPNESPQKASGAPGVAILDYDGDGDRDIYVTNGPGTANSLYSNQLIETGSVSFVDVALAAGVDATDQDSTGVCFGDIDNDGDADLYVVGTGDDPNQPLYQGTGTTNRMFENNGDGTFTDITAAAGVAGDGQHAIACSFGDVNNDGYLDVVVGNTYDDWGHRIPVFLNVEYEGLEHNLLFLNDGDGTFTDVSSGSGIEDVSNMTDAAFTWAIAMADLNQDGAIDILSADNQGGPSTQYSEERGWPRLFQNDGSGSFTDVTEQVGTNVEGGWMGLSFGDVNCDGNMDFFATNLGNYVRANAESQWFLGQSDGTWVAPGLGPNIVADPFGWGTSMADYDNDGDFDIIYNGGVDLLSIALADNPEIVFQNTGTCSGEFVWDDGAVLKDHRTRTVHGLAMGDINNDGFSDIVSVSNFEIVPFNFFPLTIISGPQGGPFDSVVRFELGWFGGFIPGFQVWLDPTFVPGTLSVELNSADNGNNWVELDTLGGKDLIPQGTVNRDGIGAVVSFTPDGGPTSRAPVLGGSSYASQDDLEVGFGLGQATSGTAEVLWPGGARNKVYDVQAGEHLTIPEIPCSYDGDWGAFGLYDACVMQALTSYLQAGTIGPQELQRLRDSAWQAYHEAH